MPVWFNPQNIIAAFSCSHVYVYEQKLSLSLSLSLSLLPSSSELGEKGARAKELFFPCSRMKREKAKRKKKDEKGDDGPAGLCGNLK